MCRLAMAASSSNVEQISSRRRACPEWNADQAGRVSIGMASFRELLNGARTRITEVLPSEAAEMLKQPGTVALDVREADEFEQGALERSGPHPAGLPRATAGGADPRPRHPGRRLLRRRGPQRVRG